jgi:hypothetical protein
MNVREHSFIDDPKIVYIRGILRKKVFCCDSFGEYDI